MKHSFEVRITIPVTVDMPSKYDFAFEKPWPDWTEDEKNLLYEHNQYDKDVDSRIEEKLKEYNFEYFHIEDVDPCI